MDFLTVTQNHNGSYFTRTKANANKSDLTCAVAIDFTTKGELLTKQEAGNRYIGLNLNTPSIDCARKLYQALVQHNAKSLNLAGNGMFTLSKHKISQRRVNLWVYDMLSLIKAHYPIQIQLMSGGQTGVDIAAAVAGPLLNIETEINFPLGYKQRLPSGLDVLQTLDEVMNAVEMMQQELRDDMRNA